MKQEAVFMCCLYFPPVNIKYSWKHHLLVKLHGAKMEAPSDDELQIVLSLTTTFSCGSAVMLLFVCVCVCVQVASECLWVCGEPHAPAPKGIGKKAPMADCGLGSFVINLPDTFDVIVIKAPAKSQATTWTWLMIYFLTNLIWLFYFTSFACYAL